MSLFGFVVAPPAMLVLRKLVRRIKGLAHNQFTGTADILETMQETLQGIRTVKAFTLEDAMRERIDANIAAVERNANKMARVANRAEPADGNARRLRDRGRADLWRLPRGRDRRDAGPVLLVPHRVPAGL